MMNKNKKIPDKKKKIDQKEFESVVMGHTNDVTYLLHTMLSLMRRMNRDEKLDDYEFATLHNTIDLVFKK
jgi:predicted membrane chloride channel (bestrophin family)